MFKYIKEEWEALEWLKSRNRPLLLFVLAVIIIFGCYKVYIFLQPKPTTLSSITSPSEGTERKKADIKNKLKKLYGEISVLSDHPIPSEDINVLQEYERQVNEWVSKTSMWIEINIGFGAREKFLNRDEGGRIWSSSYEDRYNKLMSDLKGYKLGLEELIKSDEIWFETDKNEKERKQEHTK